MKKLIMLVLVLATTIGYSQEKRTEKAKQNWTPEQMAEKRTNKMVSELSLTDAQKQRVHAMHLQKANERKAKMEARGENAKREGMKKSDAEKTQYKEQMKAILTDAQYAQWMENKSKHKGNKGAKYQKNKQ